MAAGAVPVSPNGYFNATVVPAVKAYREAELALRETYAAYERTQIAGQEFTNKEKKNYPFYKDWYAVLPEVKKVRDRIEAPARKAYNDALAAASASYDRAKAVQAATKQAIDEAQATANARYDDASAPHRTALEEAKQQARAELESKYIAIYSEGRDVSGYRRESVLKAVQGEFLNLCSQ